jgi:hypothetical protein
MGSPHRRPFRGGWFVHVFRSMPRRRCFLFLLEIACAGNFLPVIASAAFRSSSLRTGPSQILFGQSVDDAGESEECRRENAIVMRKKNHVPAVPPEAP